VPSGAAACISGSSEKANPKWIDLGPFEEPFRKFLNRQALFLERAVLF
jgi:hypothetical protein